MSRTSLSTFVWSPFVANWIASSNEVQPVSRQQRPRKVPPPKLYYRMDNAIRFSRLHFCAPADLPCTRYPFVVCRAVNGQHRNTASNVHQYEWIGLRKVVSLLLTWSATRAVINATAPRPTTRHTLTQFYWHFQSNSIQWDCVSRQTESLWWAHPIHRISPNSCLPPVRGNIELHTLVALHGDPNSQCPRILTSLKFCSNLNAPPPVAHTVVTNSAMPLDFASDRKLFISDVGNRMKCSEPRLPRMCTSSIWIRICVAKSINSVHPAPESRKNLPANVCLGGQFCRRRNFSWDTDECFAGFRLPDLVHRE